MRQITFRLGPGQLLKEEIERSARETPIRAGVLLSIVGGLDMAVLRMAGATPEKQVVRSIPGPLEIVAGTGTLSADGCHIHVALSDADGEVVGGHLKDGCIVGTTAEIVLGIFDDVRYRRRHDDATGFPELHVES